MPEYRHHENEAKIFMKKEHAEAILRGGARMPRQNEPCDMSCAFAFACANYNENGKCNGFQLLSNGKLEQHIRDNIRMDAADRLGVERYIQMVQQTDSPQIRNELLPVVYRYLKPPEKRITIIGYEVYEIEQKARIQRSIDTTPTFNGERTRLDFGTNQTRLSD
jgi:hypothetical protein